MNSLLNPHETETDPTLLDDYVAKMMKLSEKIHCLACGESICDECFKKMMDRIAEGEKPIRTATKKTQRSRLETSLDNPERLKIYLEGFPTTARFPRKNQSLNPIAQFLSDKLSERVCVDQAEAWIDGADELIELPNWAKWLMISIQKEDGYISVGTAAKLVGSWVSEELRERARDVVNELNTKIQNIANSLCYMLGNDDFSQASSLNELPNLAHKLKQHLIILKDYESQLSLISGIHQSSN